jgi:flagellar biosynthesis chaperone FliJ
MSKITRLAKVRAIREQQARAGLGGAIRDANSAKLSRADLEKRLERETGVEELRPAQLAALHLQGIASKEALDHASVVVREAERRLNDARYGWQRTAADLDSVEELEERMNQASVVRARLVAEKALDELVTLKRARTR